MLAPWDITGGFNPQYDGEGFHSSRRFFCILFTMILQLFSLLLSPILRSRTQPTWNYYFLNGYRRVKGIGEIFTRKLFNLDQNKVSSERLIENERENVNNYCWLYVLADIRFMILLGFLFCRKFLPIVLLSVFHLSSAFRFKLIIHPVSKLLQNWDVSNKKSYLWYVLWGL